MTLRENRHIGASRQLDPNRVSARFDSVVLRQLAPKPSGFDPHDGINFRVVPRRTPVHLNTNVVFFNTIAAPGKRFFHQVPQEARQPAGSENRGLAVSLSTAACTASASTARSVGGSK